MRENDAALGSPVERVLLELATDAGLGLAAVS